MVSVLEKARYDSFKDIIVEWPERVDNTQLVCDLMNIGLGQYTYLGETKFQFRASSNWDIDSFKERANEIYRKYSAFPSSPKIDN